MKREINTIKFDKQYREIFTSISAPSRQEESLRQPSPLKVVESKTVHSIGDAEPRKQIAEN